ncbi:MAG: type IX secretion system outer membrane channel protein PorV [Bacteroidales bacterium]|nr:type IX secretion system outer membrane channel protein PorV [Bacteroidales bacterium]
MILRKFLFIWWGLTLGVSQILLSQISRDELAGQVNAIQTAVPFLTITPDSRAGGMGDVGVATTPDINSQHWNAAKYAFIDGSGGVALSYSPWLRNLVNDINLAYLAGYLRINKLQTVSMSLRYFSLGDIVFTDDWGNTTRNFNPNEFAVDAAYARAFSEKVSAALAFRFIYSNLTGGTGVGGTDTKPGISFAADLSTYYHSDVNLGDKNGRVAFGANISNIGTKMSYTPNQEPDFVPINLRLGGSLGIDLDKFNTINISADINKLLVPTPPIYDSLGNISAGKDPNVSVPVGMLHSFYDAPGGIKEEFHEIAYSIGAEYWYNNLLAIRGGYFHEHETKGNRKYFSMGLGLRLNVFAVDFSYLIPVYQNNPLAGTLRFTLLFDFDSFKKQNNNKN